jgi:DNA-binding response OmpR family regulator
VLLDVKLPYIDGLRLIAMMREKEAWRRVPVLILSSVSDDRGIQRAMEAGATDYLVKPFETSALMKRVRHLTAQAG